MHSISDFFFIDNPIALPCICSKYLKDKSYKYLQSYTFYECFGEMNSRKYLHIGKKEERERERGEIISWEYAWKNGQCMNLTQISNDGISGAWNAARESSGAGNTL